MAVAVEGHERGVCWAQEVHIHPLWKAATEGWKAATEGWKGNGERNTQSLLLLKTLCVSQSGRKRSHRTPQQSCLAVFLRGPCDQQGHSITPLRTSG